MEGSLVEHDSHSQVDKCNLDHVLTLSIVWLAHFEYEAALERLVRFELFLAPETDVTKSHHSQSKTFFRAE